MISGNAGGVLNRRIRKFAFVVVNIYVLLQYIALLLELGALSRAHRLSSIVWMLPVIYPIPWILCTALRIRIKRAVAENLMTPQTFELYDNWMPVMLTVTYVAIASFSQLHVGF